MAWRFIEERAHVRFWAKVNKSGPTQPHMDTPCWVWTGASSSFGHGEVRIQNKLLRAHRVAWEWDNGSIPAGMCLLHNCDVPACVRPDHCRPGTRAENTADMMARGRHRPGVIRGEEVGNARFTDAQVVAIREVYAAREMSQYELAAKFGVSQGTIGFIVRRETWKHI